MLFYPHDALQKRKLERVCRPGWRSQCREGQGRAAAALGDAEAGEREEQGQKAPGEVWEQGQGCSPRRRRRRAGRVRAVTPAAGWGVLQPEPATSMPASTLALPTAVAAGSFQAWLSRPLPRAEWAGGPPLLGLLPRWLPAGNGRGWPQKLPAAQRR